MPVLSSCCGWFNFCMPQLQGSFGMQLLSSLRLRTSHTHQLMFGIFACIYFLYFVFMHTSDWVQLVRKQLNHCRQKHKYTIIKKARNQKAPCLTQIPSIRTLVWSEYQFSFASRKLKQSIISEKKKSVLGTSDWMHVLWYCFAIWKYGSKNPYSSSH